MDTPLKTISGPQLVVAALISYGSLYPFDFVWSDATTSALRALLEQSSLWSSRGDVAGNLLLFLPWGALKPHDPAHRRWHWPTLAYGLVLALVLQVLQLGLPSRDAALSDVLWNGIGIVIGQLILSPMIAGLHTTDRRPAYLDAAIVLPLFWLTLMALPLLPSLDWQSLKAHLRALSGPSALGLPDLLLAYGNVLVVSCALLSRFAPLRAQALLALLLALAAAAKLLTVHNTLYRTELLAWGGAWASIFLVHRVRPGLLPSLAFATMLLGLTIAGLHPFSFTASASAFNLVPFIGYLQGDMLGNVRELGQSAWLAVAILWLGARLGGHVPGIGIFLVGWVLLLEIAQMWLVGRSADITPVLTTLIVSLLMRVSLRQPAEIVTATAPRPHPGEFRAPADGRSRLAPILAAAGLWVVAVIVLAWLIRLPGVPYNLRELFLGDGHPLAIALFVLALLWLGAGSWLAIWLANRTRRPWLALPATLVLAGSISLLLLTTSVTQESIMDVTGSSNLHWMVVNKLIWGDGWAQAFSTTLGPAVVAPLERLGRYLALYTPPAAFLAVSLLALEPGAPSARRAAAFKAALALVPMLWLCKAISFDWSSTDNLNELIAPAGAFGLGGGAYLYFLLATVALNTAHLGQVSTLRALFRGLLLTAVCLPVSWLLLSKGLSPAVEKYGLVFSGTQFLLGPDRSATLSETSLQMRWAILYLGLVGAAAAGIQLGRSLTRPAN